MRTPISVARTRGSPSSLIVMPRKTAAMALSIRPLPCVGLAEATRLAYMRPARARAETPVSEKAIELQRRTSDAAQMRGFDVAADGVEPAAEGGLPRSSTQVTRATMRTTTTADDGQMRQLQGLDA